jgi:undecaprenyl-diphosphatase
MALFDAVDLPILQALTGFVGRSALFDHLVHAVASYDSFKGVPVMALLWYAWFLAPPGEMPEATGARRQHLLAVLAGSIAIVILSRLLQLGLQLHRRPILAGLGLNFPDFIDPASVNPWNCFPSDHSMLFFALATGLWRVSRRLGLAAYLWAGIMIDLPRLYLGLHYPSDVVVGAGLGILCMLGFLRLPLQPLWTLVLGWGERHAPAFYCLAFLVTEQVAHLFDDLRRLGFAVFGHVAKG